MHPAVHAIILATAFTVTAGISAPAAQAQNFLSSGQSWGGSWGFPSVSDRSLLIQQAQTIRNATQQQGPTSIVTYNTWTDNRSNYVESNAAEGASTVLDYQIGDEIGQNTNTIGAMNTGTTNIEVSGDNNQVTASNAADSVGCQDGSIALETYGGSNAANGTPSGIDISIAAPGRRSVCK